MTVAGYNHIPDVNDREPMIGVDHEEGETTATVYIAMEYSMEEIYMTVDEMRVLRGQLLTAIEEIEWQEARWVYASTSLLKINHLMRKGEHGEEAATVCGQRPPQYFTWSLKPANQCIEHMCMCKKCMKIYEKEQVNA